MGTTVEEKIVESIIRDIYDRSGIGDEWCRIDESLKTDIRLEWTEMVKDLINKEFGNK